MLRAILIAALFSGAAKAQAIRRVPGNFPSIQAAINAALPGDTVRVAPGIYVEKINFVGKAITVISEAGPEVTIIDGNQTGNVVTFASGEGRSSVLEGFTIRNGKGGAPFDGGGIRISTAGAGTPSASPTIRNNRIIGNVACAQGVGINIDSGNALIQGNLISGNNTQGCSGGSGGAGIRVFGSAEILDNIITNNLNSAGSDGGGIAVWAGGLPIIRGNIIIGNSASRGGGISISAGAGATVIQNVIALNTSFGGGGGIFWRGQVNSQPIAIINNTVVDNDSTSAIYADGIDTSTSVKNNLIIGKTGQPAILCGNTSDNLPPILEFNNVFSDQAAPYAGICTNITGSFGNISQAPVFRDRAARDFRLLSGSPGVGAGSNTADYLPAFDLDTIPRVLPVGGTVDMGAYEFAATTSSTLEALSITFGDQPAGSTSPPGDLTLTNTGTETLVVSRVTVTGEFSQTNTCQIADGIPPGQSCIITVVFSPAFAGPRSGQLTITGNSVNSTADLSGNGTGSLTLSASSLAFSAQRVGTTSDPLVLTISNTGTVDRTLNGITTNGFFTSSNNCPATMAPGSACEVTIRFAPTAREIQFGAITINLGISESPAIVTLSGLGVAPTISVTPTSLVFGTQQVGTLSTPRTVVIANQGNIALTIHSVSLTGDYSGTNDCGTSVPANATCTISVVFAPTANGTRNGVLTVTHDAGSTPQTVALTGSANSAILTLTSDTLPFGNQVVNTMSTARFVTLRNTGNAVMTITGISASAEFATANTCTSIIAGGSCNQFVTFTPTAVGHRTGTLTITSSALGSPHVVTLSGTGIEVVFSPNALAFGDVHLGATSTLTTTFTNNSPNPVAIANITASNGYIVQSACGASVASGTSCAIDVTFAPASAGTTFGTLVVTDDAVGSPHTIGLSGRGTVGNVSLSASTLAFAADVVGTTVPPRVLTLTNTGTGVLSIAAITASGDFTQTNTCAANVPIGGNCVVTVGFTPTSEGVRNGTLTIVSDSFGSPHNVSLSGTGLTSLPVPVITALSPNSRALGSQGFTLSVTGSGFSSRSVARWNGADRPTTFVSNTSLTATISASDLTNEGIAAVSVFNPAPGGGVSNVSEFFVYVAVTLSTKDLAYDRTGNRVYASVAGTALDRANTLTPIDPSTGILGPSTFIGSDPGKLAISGDSRRIYVALDGAAQIRPFDTVSQTAGTAFALGSEAFSGPYYAEDIAIDPSNSTTIAVSRRNLTSSPRHEGVAVYDNGVQRPTVTPDHTGSNVIEFSATSTTLYGFNNESTEWGFRTMAISASGVTVTNIQPNLINSFGADILFEGGRIYSTSGRVIDPVSRTLLGTFSLPTPGDNRGVAVDSELKRAFYLFATSTSVRILAFDINTFVLTGSVTLPAMGPTPGIGSLKRWGENGLAFRSATQVILLRIPGSWLPGQSISKSQRDFNGDGKSDILWRNDAGDVSMSQMNGHSIVSTSSLGNIWTGWAIVGSGDFNGDGKMDILWRDSSGTAVVWLMDGATLASHSVLGVQSPQWTVSGIADFNGDGRADLLWRHADGDVSLWLVSGSTILSSTLLGNVWTGWSIAGTGDFNGDGKADVLWRSIAGDVALWLMNGATLASGVTIASVWNGWTIAATGDFNGDGRADILWRSESGDVAIWLMNGTNLTSGTNIASIWTGWSIVGTGDYDGDGKTDILWREPSGGMVIWLMNGTAISSYSNIGNLSDVRPQ